MANVLFECNVTEFDIMSEANGNCFTVNEKCLTISLINEEAQISKEDAIKLAKLILFVYEV